jgi:hypothetical protein
VAHTFSIPTLGINVPALRQQRQRQPLRRGAVHHEVAAQRRQVLLHVARARDSTRGSASCPVRLGYLYGNGGPMQTIGYMDGFMKVVA